MSEDSGKVANLGCFLIFILVLVGAGEVKEYWHDSIADSFPKSALTEYSKMAAKIDSSPKHGKIEKIKPPVVLVVPKRWGGPKLHDDFFNLPSSIRASDPDSVATVILCKSASKTVGRYTDGTQAQRADIKVYCFDRASGKFLGSTKVTGAKPPGTKDNGGFGETRLPEWVVEHTK
jgi:hypothetical protein